jgi:hypothetical protein
MESLDLSCDDYRNKEKNISLQTLYNTGRYILCINDSFLFHLAIDHVSFYHCVIRQNL